MRYYFEEKTYQSTSKTDIFDLSGDLDEFIRNSSVKNGQVTVSVPGSTAAITTIEYESGVLEDLRQAIKRLVPDNIHYMHDVRWNDGNGYSHVRAALLGPSITLPVINGRAVLGTWQQVVCLDFDNRPRKRRVVFHIIGE